MGSGGPLGALEASASRVSKLEHPMYWGPERGDGSGGGAVGTELGMRGGEESGTEAGAQAGLVLL